MDPLTKILFLKRNLKVITKWLITSHAVWNKSWSYEIAGKGGGQLKGEINFFEAESNVLKAEYDRQIKNESLYNWKHL